MYNPGDIVEVTASPEMIKSIGADLQLKSGQQVKVLKIFPDGWVVVEGEYLKTPCVADVPPHFLKKQ